MPITLNGSTGIDTPAIETDAITSSGSAGTTGQVLRSAGSGVAPTWGSSIVLGTAQNSTSGTSIDFTGIPSWARRVTVMFSGVSTNGTSAPQIQLGTSSGVETTSYSNTNSLVAATAVASVNFTTGFGIGVNASNWTAAMVASGSITLSLVGSNVWAASGSVGLSNQVGLFITAGAKTLGGTLDRIRITTVNGTDTFDAGTINIMWE